MQMDEQQIYRMMKREKKGSKPKPAPMEAIDFSAETDASDASKAENKKKRSKEEIELKKGQIIDQLLEKMVHAIDKEVAAAPADYYHLGFYPRKPLKEVMRMA